MAWNLPHPVKHIQFRVLSTSDVTEFLNYRSDPSVARFQGWSPMTEQEATDFLAKESAFTQLHPGVWSQIGVATVGSGKLIGDVGLWLSEDSTIVEFGMSLARGEQGRGLGTETAAGIIELIFSSTPIAQIVANTDERNKPCLRALRRAGMSQTGTRTETYKGEVCTEYCFRIMRPKG